MKKILLLSILFYTVLFNLNAQEWKSLLPTKQDKALTFYDYQKAFNSYWNRYTVVNGKYKNENNEWVKAPGWKQFKRWEYYWESRVNPTTGEFPNINYNKINTDYKKAQSVVKNTGGNWVNLGPSSSPGGYAGLGRLNCIAFHPTDANTFWVGAPAGGIWQTTNGGDSWTVLNDNEQIIGVSDIVIPSDFESSNTIYIATGDRDAWDNRSVGVLKSTDGGTSWNTTGLSFNVGQGRNTNRILLDPDNDEVLIAATTVGIYKTLNGGNTWAELADYNFIDMEYKPGDFNHLYGATNNGEIYYSSDGGENWTLSQDVGHRVELAVSPDENTWVYAVVAAANNGLYGIYRSTDNGVTYTKQFDGLVNGNNLLGWNVAGTDSGGQGWYDLSIAVDPNNASTVYVGGVNTWKSTDNGINWTINNHWYGAAGTEEVHADKHALKYNENTGILFECNDGGLYRNNDDGWTFISEGLEISQMYKLGVSASESSETITGLQDNGTKLNSDANWLDVKGGDGMECIIDYTNVNIQYATYVYGQIDKTTDHWSTATDISANIPGGNSGAWVTPYLIDPNNNETLYVGYEDVWKTTDGGASFTKIGDFTDSKLQSMAISQSDPNFIYVATDSKIRRTTNGGNSWEVITNNLPISLASIKYISIKHDDPNMVWVTLGSYSGMGVYESTNGGASWTNISNGLPNIPTNCVVQNRQNEDAVELYAGTDAGVYIREGANSWELFNTGLPNVIVSELEIYYDDNDVTNSRLRAATYGRGLWESELNSYPQGLATVNTNEPNAITTSEAFFSGNVTDDAGFPISEKGFVLNTNGNPTTEDNKIAVGAGLGAFDTTFTNLNSGTEYYIRAYAINANGTNYGNQYSFSTLCEINYYSLDETFESETFEPNCWTSFTGDNGLGSENNWTSSTDAYNGSFAAMVNYQDVNGGDAEDWLVTKQIALGDNASLSFYQKQSFENNYGSQYEIKISVSSQTDYSDFTNIAAWDEDSFSTDYDLKTIDLSEYDGQVVYIAFVMTNDDGDNWFIDNVTVSSDVPSTPEASAIAEVGCTTGSVTITSNMNGEQTYYLTDGTGNELQSVTLDAVSYEFTGLSDGEYAGKVEKNGESSTLSNIVNLTNQTIPNQPSAINGNTQVCEESEQTYSVVEVPGVSYNWTIPASWSGTSSNSSITVIPKQTGGIISVTPENSCGSGAPQILEINMTNLPEQPSEIMGSTTVCIGDEISYSVDENPGMEYVWTLPEGWSGNSVLHTVTVTVGTESGEISVVASNECGISEAQTLGVAVQTVPDPVSEIQGDDELCANTESIYSVDNVPGTTYNWTLPEGWTGTSTTHEITVTSGVTGGEISVTPSNDCGEGSPASIFVNILEVPDTPSNIVGNENVCESSEQSYHIIAVDGASYHWTVPSDWTIEEDGNNITVTVGETSGNIEVYLSNECGASEIQNIAVNVQKLPEQTGFILGPDQVQQGDENIAFEIDPVSEAESYNWTIENSWTLVSGQGTEQITLSFPRNAESGQLKVYGVNSCGIGVGSGLYLDVKPIDVKALQEIGINIYPIPVKDLLTIESNSDKEIKIIELFNYEGKKVWKIENAKHIEQINTSKFSSGTYILRIFINDKWYSSKIMVVSQFSAS